LKPGSYHIMLTGLKTPLRPGQTVLLKLHLADRNGKTEVIETHAEVRGFAARSEDSQRAATTAGHHSHLH
jgi:copper(I)-binding protein